MQITLNEAEQRLAKFLARARYESNRGRNVVDRKVGPQSCEETDLEGIASELAAAKVFNVYPDLATTHAPDSDITTRFGWAIDVKATKYKNGRLLAVPGKRGKSTDFYCLLIGEFPTYRIAGVMSGDELLADNKLTDLGHGPTYAADQIALQTIEEWLKDYEGEA